MGNITEGHVEGSVSETKKSGLSCLDQCGREHFDGTVVWSHEINNVLLQYTEEEAESQEEKVTFSKSHVDLIGREKSRIHTLLFIHLAVQ